MVKIGGLALLLLYCTLIAAWVTHVVTCIVNSAWVLLLFGAFFFPVGIIHGVMVWAGIV